jgi:uncharacterized protein YpbB
MENPAPATPEPDFDPFAEVNAAAASAEFEQSAPAPPSVKSDRTLHSAINHVSSPHYWTWRVLAAGFSAEECQKIRGLDSDTLCDHVLRAGREGQQIEAEWLLTATQVADIETAVGDASPGRLQAMLANLPSGITYRDMQLYLLSRRPSTD